MPNLQDIVNNPELLESSVQTMLNYHGSRGEVILNHGISTTEELDALVNQEPSTYVDIEAYHRIVDENSGKKD